MFKIWLNGMWSKDYVQHLAAVLSTNQSCDHEHALQQIRDLAIGKRMSVMATTVAKAHELACDLLQYGCYTEIQQVAPLNDAAMITDLEGWFGEDQSRFRVVMDAEGHVSRIIEEPGFGYLRLEAQAVADWVGEELVRLGAQRVPAEEWPALQARLKAAIAENEVRRMNLRAERAATKKRRQESGLPYQEEE